ncbi:GntR family transcriptional regulator [Harryflintia acetispora]|uniref:GntR family transcriptional regulator n=1 Tax=Harryflintia acetispora TaxID=1849041 RepID=UPI00189B4C3A|nr:GntR family transcriptional regulator [Harryflintia acetispora]
MLDERGGTPLYMQLYQELLGHILDGSWGVDHKLPPEMELCRSHAVSRITVRLALDKLKSEGYLYRKQGRGTFVTKPPIQQRLPAFYSFSDGTPTGGKPKSRVLGLRRQSCPQRVAERLEVETDTEVFRIERVRSLDGVPFAYEISYVPCAVCPALTARDIEQKGLYNSLKLGGQLTVDSARESFEAVIAEKKAARYLEVAPGAPVLHIDRVAYCAGAVVEYCSSTVRGDRVKYEIMLNK